MDTKNLIRMFVEGLNLKFMKASSLTVRLSSATVQPQWELVSYDTVIARRWHQDTFPGVVTFWLNTKKYTRTTSKQQSQLLDEVTKYAAIVSGVRVAQGESDPVTLTNAEVAADQKEETGKPSTLDFKRPTVELTFRALKALKDLEAAVTSSLPKDRPLPPAIATACCEARMVLEEVQQ